MLKMTNIINEKNVKVGCNSKNKKMALASIVANFKYIQKGLSKEKSSRYLHRVVINGSILIDIPVKHKLLVS